MWSGHILYQSVHAPAGALTALFTGLDLDEVSFRGVCGVVCVVWRSFVDVHSLLGPPSTIP